MASDNDQDRIRIRMFGPHLNATSGISAVVRNWQSAGFEEAVGLHYVSTLDSYVPGHYVTKFQNALRAYYHALRASRNNTDLVHIHVSSGMSFYRKLVILLLARFRKLPAITHLHGSEFREFYASGSAIRQYLIRYFFEHSATVLTLSKSWAEFIDQVAPAACPRILYNSAPLSLYSGATNDSDSVTILFMGRLGERKGTHDLIEAFARIAPSCPQATLVLGGDGDLPRFHELVAELNLEGRVDIRGWIGPDLKVQTFVDCDIYVLPSYNEGLPGSVLEAMAAGKPVVTTPVGGIPEAVEEGGNGFLVSPGDVGSLAARLKLLCENHALRNQMGERSREIIRSKFETHNIVDRLVAIYKDVSADTPIPGGTESSSKTANSEQGTRA